MAKIETIVKDIYDLLDGKNPIKELPENLEKEFSKRIEKLVFSRILNKEERENKFSISSVGKPCIRQSWLKIKRPELRIPLSPEGKMKFLYGDIIEELLLFLCEASGHEVVGRQDKVEVEGVFGSRDAIIDGVLVDVKSCSTYSFAKFRDGKLHKDDPFGYIGQIQTYLEGSLDDPLLKDKTRCAFLVMDKTLGHICLDIHKKVDFDVRKITKNKLDIINSEQIPPRAFEPELDKKSGNLKLGTNCSYCDMKIACWENLRCFLDGGKPVYFTEIKKEPNIPELPIKG